MWAKRSSNAKENPAFWRSRSRKCFEESVASRQSPAATTPAERGRPSMAANSPNSSPACSVAKVTSRPAGEKSTMLTAPSQMKNTSSLGLPASKMLSPDLHFRQRQSDWIFAFSATLSAPNTETQSKVRS